jgi:hypothetical protein
MKSVSIVEGGAGVELAGPGTSHLAAAARHHDEHGHLRAVLVRAGHAEAALRFHGRRRTRPCSSAIWLPRVPWKMAGRIWGRRRMAGRTWRESSGGAD